MRCTAKVWRDEAEKERTQSVSTTDCEYSASYETTMQPGLAPNSMEASHADCRPSGFLMIQAARSGSDWLMSLLNTHPNICC